MPRESVIERRRPWLRAAAVAALLVPAALAARSGGSAHISVHEGVARTLVAVVAVPVVLAIGLVAVLMFPALLPPFLRSRRRGVLTRGALRVLIPAGLAIIAVSLGILALSGPRKPTTPVARPPAHRVLPAPPRTPPSEFPWWTVPAAAALIAVGVLALRRRARRLQPGAESFRHAGGAVARDAAPVALPDDPRAAVLAAYARMESSLAAAGHGRGRGEAPWGYSRRIRDARPEAAAPVAELTGLVETAAFSTHPVQRSDRRRAVSALDEIEGRA